MARTAVLAGGLASAALYASSAFVSAPTSGVSHLRAAARGASGAGPDVGASGPQLSSGVLTAGALVVAAGAAAARRGVVARRAEGTAVAKKESAAVAEASIPRPEDLLDSPKFPLYMGSSGGYMSRATRERHAITWTAKEESAFEMPTGGTAIMNKGENLCYFRKKEQALALGKQLRKSKIENYKIYRVAKDGSVLFLHPADGVFPEKVNKGRVQVNGRPFSAGGNPNPGSVKWTKYHQKAFEADALTTMFVKARVAAYSDTENIFPIPNVEGWVPRADYPEYSKKLAKALESVPDSL